MADAHHLPDAEALGGGLNPLHVLARRWPFLVVGLVIGAVVGVLLYVTAVPQYQSRAQVLVIKKGSDLTKEGDGRMVEDHVATQVTLIKSEKIRMAAARNARAVDGAGLPGDDRGVADMIGAGLTVARDKDSATASVGSGVLNLTLRGDDAEVCRRLLGAVILAHKGELFAIYEQSAKDRSETLDRLLDVVKKQRTTAGDNRISHLSELRKITTEEVANVRLRVSAQRDQVRALNADISNLTAQLEFVAKSGQSPEERHLTLAQLTARPPGTPASAADQFGLAGLRALEFERRELTGTRSLGKDHPQVLALDVRIAAFKEQMSRPTPEVTPALDELGAYTKWIEQKKTTANGLLKVVEGRLKDDERTLKDAGGLQDQADAMATQMQHADAEILRLETEKLARQAAQGGGGYSSEQITPPATGAKVAPVLARSLMTGVALGALLGVGLMLLAETRDKSFRSPAEIRQRLGLPVVGHIPRIQTAPATVASAPAQFDPSLVAALRPQSPEAESYRGLRTQLYFSTQGRGHQVIQVTSPTPDGGKSTLAANLALSVAQSGKRTVLVDCDLRKPRVHKLFGVATKTGLTEVIAGLRPLSDGLLASGTAGLDLLPCGPRPLNPAELLGSPQFQQVLAELKERYDFVIIDSPPLLAVADPAIVAPQVDGVLLVFRMTKTSRPTAERAREVLAGVGANALGVIVNAASYATKGYGSNYEYRYNYGNYDYSDHSHNVTDEDEK